MSPTATDVQRRESRHQFDEGNNNFVQKKTNWTNPIKEAIRCTVKTTGWHYVCFTVDIQITDRQNVDKITFIIVPTGVRRESTLIRLGLVRLG
jgi:hypothetical protein